DETFIPATTRNGSRESGMVTVTVQPDGKPILGGIFNSPFGKHYLARFLEDGSDDPTFSNTNQPLFDFCTQLKVLSDGSIVRGGAILSNSTQILLERFLPDRARDPNFHSDISLPGVIVSFDVQKDGKVIASVGSTPRNQPRLIRFHKNGALDHTFESPQARFSLDGQGTAFESGIADIIVQPNGDILVGGVFTSYNGQNVTNLVRIIGERAYIKTVESIDGVVRAQWILTEPEKAYTAETSSDLRSWSRTDQFTRNADHLEVALPSTGNGLFFRVVQQ
ncbi:MAG: hypothetical protein ACXW3Z_14780, partial [Limisphaerales bacterium]